MARRYEWRSRSDDEHRLLALEEGRVVATWPGERQVLRDFLNDMTEVRAGNLGAQPATDATPDSYGEVVLARSDEGDIERVNPELYWGAISVIFRTHGEDPHLWRRHRY